MRINDLKKYHWEQYWAGNWSFLTAYYFADYYTTSALKIQIGENFNKAIIISRQGYSYCYLDSRDRETYGKFVGNKIAKSLYSAKKFCTDLKSRADSLCAYLSKLIKQPIISEEDYRKFIEQFLSYSGHHICVRNTVDFLPPKKQESMLEIFQDVRKYIEKVYSGTERFMNLWATQIGKMGNMPPNFILCCTPDEIETYYRTRKLPDQKILKKRFKISSLLFDKKGHGIFVGKSARTVETLLQLPFMKSEIKGQIAYVGKVKGRARIIFNPTKKNSNFHLGDILVTGMTRPEFLPLMKKASAFVTDAGGILSHAAIVARELKKPCVIGTKIATKVLHDGDYVEVDANNGIVRIIKKMT